jgi:hypothetical protein
MTDSARPTALRVDSQGLIFDAQNAPDSEAVAYFTSLLQLESGTILAGWQSGPAKHTPINTIRLARSRDAGETWNQLPFRFETSWQETPDDTVAQRAVTPGSFLAAEMAEAEPGRIILVTTWVNRSIPERPLFNPETEGILQTRLLYCSSTDEGDTWSEWSELATAGLTGCAITGPVVRWSDGTLAIAFESFKEFDDPTPVEPAAWLCVSKDGGRTFDEPWRVAQHPKHEKYFWDQRLCATNRPGEFVAMFWTHNRAEQRDVNVHLLQATLDETSGAAELPVETSIPGQIAACGVSDDGRILAFVVDRGQPGTMTLWRSCDGGETWPEDDRLVVHTHDELAAITQGRENIDFAEFWEDMGKWSFGHPAIRPIENGWLLAWYAGTPNRMSIHWARIVESLP